MLDNILVLRSEQQVNHVWNGYYLSADQDMWVGVYKQEGDSAYVTDFTA